MSFVDDRRMLGAIAAAVGVLGGGAGMLTNTACTTCPGGNAGEERISFDEGETSFTAQDFDQYFGLDGVDDGDGSFGSTPWAAVSDDKACAFACRYVIERDVGPGSGTEKYDYDSCELTEDTTGADPIYAVTCAGQYTLVSFCEGRRPMAWRSAHEPSGHATGKSELDVAALHEWVSVTAFEELAEYLTMHGFPADLCAQVRQAAEDERRHTEMLVAMGARDPRGMFVPHRSATTLVELAIHNAVAGCVEEGWAAVRAARRAEVTAEPERRVAFAQIASDESRHAQLAWALHGEFLTRLEPHQAARVTRALQEALTGLTIAPPGAATSNGPVEARLRGAARAFAQALAA